VRDRLATFVGARWIAVPTARSRRQGVAEGGQTAWHRRVARRFGWGPGLLTGSAWKTTNRGHRSEPSRTATSTAAPPLCALCEGASSVAKLRTSVVLPASFRPSKAWTVPTGTIRSTSTSPSSPEGLALPLDADHQASASNLLDARPGGERTGGIVCLHSGCGFSVNAQGSAPLTMSIDSETEQPVLGRFSLQTPAAQCVQPKYRRCPPMELVEPTKAPGNRLSISSR
jgi:hypothetical protein